MVQFIPRSLAAGVFALVAIVPGTAGAQIRLVDAAAPAGLTLLNISGTPTKDFVVDANGNGAAFFDYDNDRDLDALIVNGSTLRSPGHGRRPDGRAVPE